MAPAGGARAEGRMIVFEGTAAATVRAAEFEVASRRIAARAFPYTGEAGTSRFRFDPVERRFLSRAAEGTVVAGPHEPDAWRTALLRGPAGPVLVGPCSKGEKIRGSYLAAAEGARMSGRAVYLLDPEPEGLPEEPGAAFSALFVWFPGLERPDASLAAALERGIPSGWILPLVAGWTATPEAIEETVAAAAAGGARFLAPVPLADDGQVRRVAVEAACAASPEAADGIFERVHHGGSADEMREAQERVREACERAGMRPVPTRPVGLREPANNAAAAGRLEEKAQAASGDEHRAALLHAAARWIDESGRDLASIAREGNFGKVFPFGSKIAREAEEALMAGTG
jgi:hypothetical protein